MSRRFERAGILSSRADPLVCACGAALAVVGLLIVELSLALPGALAGVLSSASIATPVGAVSLVALGVCLAMRGVRERPSILTWAIEALALVVVAACGAQVLGIALSPQVSAAWELARSPDSASFTSVLLRADLWLLVGSALVLLSLAPEGLAETATRACSLLVVATVAFLLTMVGALYASEGSDGGTVMVAVIIGLVAHICAVGVLRVREDEPSFVTRVATLLPLAPVVAIGVIVGTRTWAPQDPVSPPIAVGAALLLYLGGVVAFAATRLARSARSSSAAEARSADLTAMARAAEEAGGHGTWRFQLGTQEVELSDMAARILGRSSSVVPRESLALGIHAGDAAAMSGWMEGLSDATGPTSVVVRMAFQGSDEKWIEFAGTFAHGSSQVCGTVRDVTFSKRALDRLEATVALLKGVAATVPDVDFVYDVRSLKYDYMNRPLGQLFGIASELTGTFIEDHVHQEDAKRYMEHVRAVNSSLDDAVHQVDYRVVRDDGRVVWIRSRASVFLRAEDGTPLKVFGTVQDVTEMKEAVRMLEDAKAQFERVSSQSPGVIYRFARSPSGEMSFPYLSEAALQIFGVLSEEIKRSPESAFDLVHPDDLAGLYERIELSARTMTDFVWAGRVSKNGGSTRWIQANSRPSRLEDGTTVWDGVAIDVTAMKEAEIALQRTNDRMDQLLSQSPTVVYECAPDPPYLLTTVASNVRALLGLYPDQVVGRSLFSTGLAHADDEEAVRLHGKRFIDHGNSSLEYRMRTVSGDYVWVRDDVRIVSHEQGRSEVVGAWTDVTVQKEAMLRLIESESRHQRTAASLPGMVFELLLHEDGRPEFTYVSQGSFALTGLAPQEIVARPEALLRLIDTEDKTRLYRELVRTQRDLGDLFWEGTLTTASGVAKRIRFTGKCEGSGDDDGSWSGIAADVSVERAFAEAAAASHELIDDLLASVSDAVVEFDGHGRVTGANESVLRLLGYRGQEIVGLDIGALLSDEERSFQSQTVSGYWPANRDENTGDRREVFAHHKSGALIPVAITVLRASLAGAERYLCVLQRTEPGERRAPAAAAVTVTEPAAGSGRESLDTPMIDLGASRRIEMLVVASESEAQRLLFDEPGKWSEFSVTIATSIGLGLELAKKHPPEVLLFASLGPVQVLFGVLEAVRTDEDLADVPVIVLDRIASPEARERLVRSGATRVLEEIDPLNSLSDLIGSVVRKAT